MEVRELATDAEAPFAVVTWIGSGRDFLSPVLYSTQVNEQGDRMVIVEPVPALDAGDAGHGAEQRQRGHDHVQDVHSSAPLGPSDVTGSDVLTSYERYPLARNLSTDLQWLQRQDADR